MCQSPHRLPIGLAGNPNGLSSLSMNRCFARNRLISLHMNDGKMKSEEKLSSALDDVSATYEGTGGFVKGLVSVLTELVNMVMARSAQVCETLCRMHVLFLNGSCSLSALRRCDCIFQDEEFPETREPLTVEQLVSGIEGDYR